MLQFISQIRFIWLFQNIYLIPLVHPPNLSPPHLQSHANPLMKLHQARALMWDFTALFAHFTRWYCKKEDS